MCAGWAPQAEEVGQGSLGEALALDGLVITGGCALNIKMNQVGHSQPLATQSPTVNRCTLGCKVALAVDVYLATAPIANSHSARVNCALSYT